MEEVHLRIQHSSIKCIKLYYVVQELHFEILSKWLHLFKCRLQIIS